jgi:hypothetical protein
MDDLAAALRERATAETVGDVEPTVPQVPGKPQSALPMVEHDGRWHTLH